MGQITAGVNITRVKLSALRQIARKVNASGHDELAGSLERFVNRGRSAITRMEHIVSAVRKAHRSGNLSGKPREIDLAEELGFDAEARLVILHGDDLGMCQAANAAAREVFTKGWLTSGSASVK